MHHQPTPGHGPGGAPSAQPGTFAARNTLRALERLAAGPCSAPELAADLGMDPRSARRLLHRLRTEGYAVQDAGHRRRYRATLRLVAVGAALAQQDALLRASAREVLPGLATTCDAVAHLSIAVGEQTWCVALASPGEGDAEPPAGLTMRVDIGVGPSVATVLQPARETQRSFAYGRDAEVWTAAAAVLDRGQVAAAVGVTGRIGLDAVAYVAASARELERHVLTTAVG